jgi:PAS domain-containing protein
MHTAESVKGQADPQGIFFKEKTGDPSLDEHLGWIRKVNWTSTPLGPLESWPLDFIQLCHVCLLDPEPRLLLLRPERVLFYNEAYAKLVGDKHPSVLGQNAIDAWGEVALDSIKIPLATAEATGRRVHILIQPLTYKRDDFIEEVFVAWAVMSLQGSVPGFYVSFTDVTEATLTERRRAVIRALQTACNSAAWDLAQDSYNLWQSIAKSLTSDSLFPFAFLYVMSPNAGSESSIDTSEPSHRTRFQLEGAVGDQIITSTLPEELGPDHFVLSLDSRNPTLIRQNEKHVWFLSAHDCVLIPLRSNRSETTIAYLFLGTDPKRPHNETYQEWLHELTRCLGNAITDFFSMEENKRKQHYQETQRLQALERARSWEKRFANFAEMAPIAIYFGSQSDHRVSYCNRAWFEMTGHPVVPCEEIDWASIIYEEDLELVRSHWTSVFSTQNYTSIQFRLQRRLINGKTIGPIWVTSSAIPEHKEDGSIKGIIGTMLDISALKFTEMEQQIKVQEATEAKRQSLNFIDMTSQ